MPELVERARRRSAWLFHLNTGSCNGCELEIVALNNPVHDIERFGIHFVASPRHADALHLLGVIAHQRGDEDAAIERIRDDLSDPDRAPDGTDSAPTGGIG